MKVKRLLGRSSESDRASGKSDREVRDRDPHSARAQKGESMKDYRVTWEIEVSAESPEVAAKQAREIMLDPDSLATSFEVQEFSPIYVIDVGSGGARRV